MLLQIYSKHIYWILLDNIWAKLVYKKDIADKTEIFRNANTWRAQFFGYLNFMMLHFLTNCFALKCCFLAFKFFLLCIQMLIFASYGSTYETI